MLQVQSFQKVKIKDEYEVTLFQAICGQWTVDTAPPFSELM